MDLLHVTILGDPVPKGRPRGRGNQFYTPRRTVEAERTVRSAALSAYGFSAPYPDPVGIEVVFYCATRRRTDGDNLLKLVTDALQCTKKDTGVIEDDSQILEWYCRLRRKAAGEDPRTFIRLYPLRD